MRPQISFAVIVVAVTVSLAHAQQAVAPTAGPAFRGVIARTSLEIEGRSCRILTSKAESIWARCHDAICRTTPDRKPRCWKTGSTTIINVSENGLSAWVCTAPRGRTDTDDASTHSATEELANAIFDGSLAFLNADGAQSTPTFIGPANDCRGKFSDNLAYRIDDEGLIVYDGATGQQRLHKLPLGAGLRALAHASGDTAVVLFRSARSQRARKPRDSDQAFLIDVAATPPTLTSISREDVSWSGGATYIKPDGKLYWLDGPHERNIDCLRKDFPNLEPLSGLKFDQQGDHLYATRHPGAALIAVRNEQCHMLAQEARHVSIHSDGTAWFTVAGIPAVWDETSGKHHLTRRVVALSSASPNVAWAVTEDEHLLRLERRGTSIEVTHEVHLKSSSPRPVLLKTVTLEDPDVLPDMDGHTAWITSDTAWIHASVRGNDIIIAELPDLGEESMPLGQRRLFYSWGGFAYNGDGGDDGDGGGGIIEPITSSAVLSLQIGSQDVHELSGARSLPLASASKPATISLDSGATSLQMFLLVSTGTPGGRRMVGETGMVPMGLPSQITWRTPGGTPPQGVPLMFEVYAFHGGGGMGPTHYVYGAWENIVFVSPPVVARPWHASAQGRGFGLAVLTLFVVGLLGLGAVRVPTIGRWLGLAISGIGLTAAEFGLKDVSVFVYGVTLGAGTIFAGVFGALSPALLATFGQSQPTRAISWLVCRLPRVRRRLYVGPMRRTRAWIDEADADVNVAARLRANYVALPAVLTTRDDAGKRTAVREPRPADYLESTLVKMRDRPHVLIVAPSGQGKTALLRELVRRLLERFEQSPRNPLPVVLDMRDVQHGLLDVLWTEVQRSLPDREAFEWAVDAGDYIVVIDGLTERGAPAKYYKDYFVAHGTRGIRCLATARPGADVLKPFWEQSVVIWSEPQPLDDNSLPIFLEAQGRTESLPSWVLDACRHQGVYSPLLIRLALLALDELAIAESVDSNERLAVINSLYRGAVHRLVRTPDDKPDFDLIRAAAALAYEAYWERGLRSFGSNAGFVDTAVLARLRGTLLVTAGSGDHVYRFVHDSIQVFLAADHLFRKERWDCFYVAATDQRFVGAIGGDDFVQVPEMLRFCVAVFDPLPRVRARLVADLRKWTREHADLFGRAQILGVSPAALRDHLAARTAVGDGASLVMSTACDWAETASIEDLAVFYVRVACVVAPAVEAPPELPMHPAEARKAP